MQDCLALQNYIHYLFFAGFDFDLDEVWAPLNPHLRGALCKSGSAGSHSEGSSSSCSDSSIHTGKDYYIDGQLIFLKKWPLGEGKKPAKLHPRGGFFWTMIFYNLKKFTSRSIQWGIKLYFEFTRSWSLSCSNTAIFLTNYLKWEILASYNNLRIGEDSEFAIWYFLKVLQILSEFLWHYKG